MQNGERKRSTDSDKSLSSLSAIISDSRSQPKDIVILQKKMKVLRDAVIKERQSKETIVKSKNDLALEVERLRAQVLEKDAFLLKLRNDNADLHDKLTIQRKKAENFAQQSGDGNMHLSGVLGGFFGTAKKGQNEEFQKLQTEHNYLRKQLEVVLEKLTKSEELLDQSKRESKHQIDGLQRQLTEKERDLEDKIHAYLALDHKNQDIEARNESLEKDKARLENELMKARKELDKINNERDDLEKNNIERLRTMNEMNEVCQTMEKEIESLTDKVRQLATDLEESELKLQVFDLKKVGKVVDTPAQILLRKNIAGENVIEMENAGERLVIYPQSIQSFGPHKETEDRFYIEYKAPDRHLQKDSFIAKDRKKVLRHLMNVVKYGKENKTPSSSKKNSVVEKNILSQVVSFFGN